MITEIFKDIEGYEGLYQVSNFGRIKSLNYHRTGKERVLKEAINTYGYLRVVLSKKGKSTPFLIHRLVAQAFIPNPDNLPEVNHKIEGAEGKKMNQAWNLEWCDKRYNSNYGTRIQRIVEAQTNKNTSKPVAQYDLKENLVKEYPSLSEVERQTGFDVGNISKCCNGIYNQAYGYQWKFI